MLLSSVQKMMENNHFNTEKKEVIEVSIHNNGKLKNRRFSTIFDKFYQSRDQNVKKPIGSGLGSSYLQTDYRTPQREHLGESTLGNGATFIFTLPNYNTTEKQ
jgi:signal transduction histidine kinase